MTVKSDAGDLLQTLHIITAWVGLISKQSVCVLCHNTVADVALYAAAHESMDELQLNMQQRQLY